MPSSVSCKAWHYACISKSVTYPSSPGAVKAIWNGFMFQLFLLKKNDHGVQLKGLQSK